ncbi:MAG: BglG family transcription antiterminator [Clostridiales bacterium]|nr:BglG family transcription antiterminator [Clostridiales bacterium]
MPLYMNARCKQIINLLLTRSEYISMNQLAQALGVSRRTVYYDLEKINLWLKQAQMPELEIVREKGVFISHSRRKKIQRLLETDTQEQIYIFSPEERVKCIICQVIYSPEPVYLEQLTDCLEVSRNTVFTDLKEVTRTLKQYGLSLEYQPKTGYYLSGDQVRIRALFCLYFNELRSLFTSGAVKFFQMEQIQGYLETLEQIQAELGIDYVEGVLLSLAALVPLSYRDGPELVITGLKEAEIKRTREFALIGKHFPDLPESEQLYLTLHLLGSRVNIVPDEFFEGPSREYVYDLTKTLIAEFERVACIVFDNRDELERALFVHLNTSLYRYQYGIQIGNLLGDDIMHEYPELFAITKITAKHLEEDFGVPLPDSEVAYLAMHFGGFLKISGQENNRLRILIVCVNGISTGNMLKREVQKLLPFAEIVGVVSAVKLVNAQDICDLIISTVRLNSVIPVITVHPILTEFDRQTILSHRLVAPKNVEVQRDNLFRVVKKYVRPSDYDSLLQDLTAYIQGGIQPEAEEEPENGLLSVLDISRVRFCDQRCTWKQSIRLAGQCLLDCNSIQRRYLDAIIDQLQHYGPYMFLNNDVILAHARPEDGVNCLDLSLTVFREPVVFSEYRRAKLVLVLAAEDQEKHLKILQDLLTLLSQPDAADQLAACENATELLQQVSRLLAAAESEEEETP